MATIKQSVTVKIDVSPEVLAEVFADLDDGEQARFFNFLARYLNSQEFSELSFISQLNAVRNHPLLTPGGRRVMGLIGE